MTKIECRLYNMLIADQELPPDVEIKWDGGYYVQMKWKDDETRGEGLQIDGNEYNKKRELCRKISDALFELQELIEKEKSENDNRRPKIHSI